MPVGGENLYFIPIDFLIPFLSSLPEGRFLLWGLKLQKGVHPWHLERIGLIPVKTLLPEPHLEPDPE